MRELYFYGVDEDKIQFTPDESVVVDCWPLVVVVQLSSLNLIAYRIPVFLLKYAIGEPSVLFELDTVN